MLNSCATNVLSQLRSVIVGVAFTELRPWLRVGVGSRWIPVQKLRRKVSFECLYTFTFGNKFWEEGVSFYYSTKVGKFGVVW